MRFLIIAIIVFFHINLTHAQDLSQIRADYVVAINDSEKADELYAQLSSIKNPDPLILAYFGASKAVKAKHDWNPVNKLNYIKEAFNTVNQAVSKKPDQMEIRFLRFSLAYYVPSFLGYSKNIEIDKKKIIELLNGQNNFNLNIDPTILKNMVNFMIDSKLCNDHDIAILRKVTV